MDSTHTDVERIVRRAIKEGITYESAIRGGARPWCNGYSSSPPPSTFHPNHHARFGNVVNIIVIQVSHTILTSINT